MIGIFAERISPFGFEISTTVFYTWIVMAVLIIFAVLIRIFVVPHFKDAPTGLQNVLEAAIELVTNYAKDKTGGHLGMNLTAYVFSISLMMIGCSIVELFGKRLPLADLTMTAAFAVITFVLINYFGIKQKGIGGRLKSLSNPTPVVFPIRVLTDIAIPVSMACRLFGNMLGGLIIMDLIYMSLGKYALGISAFPSLYFNVFHPLIQTFIFITLTLTFINEAVE